MTKQIAGEFYAEHKGKPFYDGLVEMMSSAPIVVQVLEKEHAIADYRALMGATDPQKATEGTIRARFGTELPCNAVHGSDSPESAASPEVSWLPPELQAVTEKSSMAAMRIAKNFFIVLSPFV